MNWKNNLRHEMRDAGRLAFSRRVSACTIIVVSRQRELPMRSRRILASWIGHADLLAMADDLGEAGQELLAAAKVRGKYGEKPGPLKAAVSQGSFDEVHLLSNYPEIVHKPFATWLGGKPVIHHVELADPTDYPQ